MSLKRNSEIIEMQGDEGTKIKRYFRPDNTLNTINYSIAHFTLGPEKRSKMHKIRSSEIYYILDGDGTLHVDEKTYKIRRDDSVLVPPNSIQFIKNDGKTDLKFLCIVDPAWKADDETILE